MSYKDTDNEIVEVRKVPWDGLWHVVYMFGKRLTWDRVTRNDALHVIEKMEKRK